MRQIEKPIKIIQLTDTHLLKDDSLLYGINTKLSYQKVLQNMEADLVNTDAVFLTGDLSHDESYESYQIIVDSFKNYNKKIFWIPGNHDSLRNMEAAFSNQKNFIGTKKFSTSVWDFIFLNTKLEGVNYGLLTDNDLEFLKNELKQCTSKPVAIVMHHHPTEIETPLIDKYLLKNNKAFFEIINNSKVQLIICGHVHGDYSLLYDNIPLETGPASCFQFRKKTTTLSVENNIGYKIYYFSRNTYVSETKIWKN